MQQDALIQRMIPEIYSAGLHPAGWSGVAASIADAAGARCVAVVKVGLDRIEPLVAHGYIPEQLEAMKRHCNENPFPRAAIAGRHDAGRTLTGEMLVPDDDFRRSVYFNEVHRPWKINSLCFSILASNPDRGQFILLGVFGSALKARFDRETIALLGRLAPHVACSMEVHTRLNHLRQSLYDAWEALLCGVVLVDAKGGVIYANSKAQRIAAQADGFAIQHGTLSAARPDATQQLSRLLGRVCELPSGNSGNRTASLTLPRPSGKLPLLLRFSPLGNDNPWRIDGRSAAAVIFVDDPEIELKGPEALLEAWFGLTRAEAAVAVGLADGFSVAEIAEQRRSSFYTVRTQAHTIHEKLGVRKRAQLVKIVLHATVVANIQREQQS